MADPFTPIFNEAAETSGFTTPEFARASRHSRIVRVLKFALPASALAIIAAFGLTAMQARIVPEVDVEGLVLQAGRIVMDNPKLNGVTVDNQPYTVTASRALQSASDINDIELEDITAKIPTGPGTTADVVAPTGHLNNKKQILTLKGGFTMTTSDGIVAKLQDAVFDFGTRTLKTEKPVDINRAGTHIQADSMTITGGGAALVFERRVRMIIQPDSLK